MNSQYSSVSQSSEMSPPTVFRVGGPDNDQKPDDTVDGQVSSRQCPDNVPKPLSSVGKNLECRVCGRDKTVFFCSDCIRNGDFTYSKQRIPERFAEKKFKAIKLKTELIAINEKIEQQLSDGFTKDELEFRIRSLESNVVALTASLTKAKLKLNSCRHSLNKSQLNQSECKERQTKLAAKIIEAKQYLIRRQNSIAKLRESKVGFDSYIKDLVQQRVQQLITFIFPIEPKDTLSDSNDRTMTSSSESTPLLEPICDSIANYKNYTIVEPWLNGNGDYSAFALYVSNDRDLPNRDTNMRNPKHRMCAALAFIAQMINIIAFYLDIKLPKRLSYSEFFANDLNESQFAHKVAKLNTNIVYLCLSQDIDTELLNPRQTAKNLHDLVHYSNKCLGLRNHPIALKANFYESMESALSTDLSLVDESDLDDSPNDFNDENLIVEYDWVEPSNIPDLQLNMSQQTSITNLFATVGSFFGLRR